MDYMARALELAALGRYSTRPNPNVGCVIVKEQRIIGEGWHQLAGTAHAEVHALAAAGASAQGATAYVTLEPCSHQGKTGPCCMALINAGISKVVIAMADPNPLVKGRGIAALKAAGINVEVLDNQHSLQAAELNRGFIKRMTTGLPWVTAKLAMSLDGRTAMASGESKWITGSAARKDVQRLRAAASAIISGADTVLLDDARLTVRAEELELPAQQKSLALQRPPLRVVIDGRLRVPATSQFFQAGATIIASYQQPALLPAKAELLLCPAENNKVALQPLLTKLASTYQCNEVLVEAGASLSGAFLQAGLLDEVIIYVAGKLLGSNARPLFDLPLEQMAQAVAMPIHAVQMVGDDLRISCRLP